MTRAEIKVLDHGYARLIGTMGTDETVVEAARMSTGKGFIGWDLYHRCDACGMADFGATSAARLATLTNPSCTKHELKKYPRGDLGLLTTLYSQGHHTPFEMCEMAVEFYWPIMVGREAMRHRVFSFNEFSARYAQMPNDHYIPELSRFQRQSTTNRQGSAEPFPPDEARQMQVDLAYEQKCIYDQYEGLVEEGLAKEVARLNAPVSRYTRVRMKGDLRGWLGFLSLRLRPNAQWEIQQFAKAAETFVQETWPRCYDLFIEHDLNGVRLSASEVGLLRRLLGGGHGVLETETQALLKKLEPR